jgi:hypothetical protein
VAVRHFGTRLAHRRFAWCYLPLMSDDVLAEMAIARLQRAYADAATRKAWSELAALFTPDCRIQFDTSSGNVIEVIGGEAFGAFAAKTADRFAFWEYVPLNFVVEIDPAGTARGRTYSFEIDLDDDTGEIVNSYGLYHDDYVRVDGTWLWNRRRYQTLARRKGDEAMVSFPLKDRQP